jgi:hypothetical protein
VASRWPKRPDILARWSRAAIPVKPSATRAARRDRMVSAVVRTMEIATARRMVRRSAHRQLAFAATIAALFLVALGTWSAIAPGGAMVARLQSALDYSHQGSRGRDAVAVSPSIPAVPIEARPARSGAGLRLPSGVALIIGPETRFEWADVPTPSNPREELVLELGLVRAEVPKLPEGHVFAVRTPDALVTVHGTSFSVEVTKVGPSAPPTTTVLVTHGVVSVQHGDREALLYAGMEWSSSGDGLSALPAPPGSKAGAVAAPRLAVAAPEPTGGGTRLGEQNVLFAEAKRARTRGDQIGAVRILNDLIRRYPASPLSQDAHVETFRALAQMGDRAGAAHEAARYLALYQDGFAREEARELSLESNSGR